MLNKLSVLIVMVVFCVSCNNGATEKKSTEVKDPTAQNAQAKTSLPDIAGVYRLPETGCDLVITFTKEGDGFKYFIKGNHIDVEGKAIVADQEGDIYVTFDGPTGANTTNQLSGLYKDDALTIQNYGNADNKYNFFEDCQEKYLEFKKQ